MISQIRMLLAKIQRLITKKYYVCWSFERAWIQMNFHQHWHINRYDVACDLKKFAVLSDGHFGVK